MRQLHTREQSGSDLSRLGYADMAAQRRASFALHLGTYPLEINAETRLPRVIEPADLSDAELAAQVEMLSAQHERMEDDAREGLAEAQRTHIAEKQAAQPKLSALIAHVERVSEELRGSEVQVDLSDAVSALVQAASTLQETYFQPRAYADVYPRAPLSLSVALEGCRKEQRARASVQQAEVEKLRAQLAALGVSL